MPTLNEFMVPLIFVALIHRCPPPLRNSHIRGGVRIIVCHPSFQLFKTNIPQGGIYTKIQKKKEKEIFEDTV